MGSINLPPPHSYIFCTCVLTQCRIHGKFDFRLRQLIAIPVWAQLCYDCQGEESPPKVVFHQGSSSTKGCLPRRSSSTKGRLPPKVVFHQWLSSTEDIASYDPMWPHVSQFGPIWSRRVPNVPVWSCMVLVLYGDIWFHLVLYGSVWASMVLFDPIWSPMAP